VIVGASGSGKSTLLRCMNRLETPTRGTVDVLGVRITDKGVRLTDLRRRIGMVFQQFNLFPHLTALQNVAEGPITVLGTSKAEAFERARRLLDKVGVLGRADERPKRLSGGQQQRVAIARALALDPEIMLFDEPTSALDPELRAEVLETMRTLAGEGMTMVIVTHEMGFARRVADRVVFIDDGRIVEQGDPRQVLNDPQSPRLQKFLNLLFWGDES
jgi:ABC-type polar amino acid transport system ATPase subunit